ncbi:MAG: ABC transporter substrate-binding protein [Planctomycetota bacterium]|nr:ABC transporter substrate-binding protein [Planctomycetota bacterium]
MKKTAILFLTWMLAATAAPAAQQKVLHLPLRSAGPGSLDPVAGSTVYDNRAASMAYETLVQYKYLKRPLELEPLLIEEIPTPIQTDEGYTFRFKLKQGIRFQDDPCFPGGKGRELVASDVIYSWKRLADKKYQFKNWWIVDGTIKGFNAYKEAQTKRVDAGQPFDYDAPVAGLRALNDYEFEVVLEEPVYSFIFKLAQFQLSVVPREAVEKYGDQFSRHPVGTGPFVLEEWMEKKSMVWVRNPTFHEELYPREHMPEDEELGLHLAAGKRLPFVDRVEITMYVAENPMWLQFKAGQLDYTQVPAENFLEAFYKRSWKLKKDFREKGIVSHAVPLLDFIFRGFNMEDEVLGGYTDEKRWLRQAIHHAADLGEFNDVFYNRANIVYDGMIPPGLAGHPADGVGPVSYPFDIERAKELLSKAGYPDGKGLPTINYYVSASGNIPEQAELFKRQMGKIGIELNVRILTFPQLIDAVNKKKAPMFGFAWSSDYPDGENNLALFYGPNAAPGSNHYNYKNDAFDELYREIRVMAPSSERTKLYEEMRDMVLVDCPYVGAMARTRFYLINPWLKNFKPSEDFYNWVKYMDLNEVERTP